MELITAILLFFGMITPDQTQMSPELFNSTIQNNQSVVQFYHSNPDELSNVAGSLFQIIDRAED